MNKEIMKEMYVPLNLFRKRIAKSGIVTPKIEPAFMDAYNEYSSYPDEVHELSKLCNVRGWGNVNNIHTMIDLFNVDSDHAYLCGIANCKYNPDYIKDGRTIVNKDKTTIAQQIDIKWNSR